MAMSGYQYGTSPRKLEPEYNPYRQTKQTRPKQQSRPKKSAKALKLEKKKKAKQALAVLAIFGILLAISYRNSQINESFSQVQSLKTELASVQKENEQLEVNIENSLNLNNIEQIAKEKLGMQKLTNKQTVYVELPKKDYVKSGTDNVIEPEQNGNWFTNLINKVFKK